MSKLRLSSKKIQMARRLAEEITRPILAHIERHTTVSVERATLRALSADGVNRDGVPVPNLAVESLGDGLGKGAAARWLSALVNHGGDTDALNQRVAEGLDISKLKMASDERILEMGERLVRELDAKLKKNVEKRSSKQREYAAAKKSPLLYLIVATGNIYEDVKQARAAAGQGADVVAVIRSTAQSLLDYVPYGPTTEGFGGTYATQENFRIMRRALDEVAEKEKRYIHLVNYASGLCMPEIAVMGALERLDMMLNDSMYGILFRDINPLRTFVDQHFSRMINSLARIVINTGEDNYLTTSDAFEKAYTVLASQLINEQLAKASGLPSELMGLGHAFEINPAIKNSFLYEVAQAEMAREIFPDCPLKYMPPTKFMTGDIFKGYVMNTLFNFASRLTGQGIHLLGMLTEAIHTPFLQDRYLAVENAIHVMNAMADLGDEITYKKNGIIATRANQVLDQTVRFLEEVAATGLFCALEAGRFAEARRPKNGGKGADGVVEKDEDYWNPVAAFLEESLELDKAKSEVSDVG